MQLLAVASAVLRGMRQFVCDQALASGRAGLVLAAAEVDVAAKGVGVAADAVGECGSRRVAVHAHIAQVVGAEAALVAAALLRSERGAGTERAARRTDAGMRQ